MLAANERLGTTKFPQIEVGESTPLQRPTAPCHEAGQPPPSTSGKPATSGNLSGSSTPPQQPPKMRLTYTDDPPKMATPADQAWVDKLMKQRGNLGLGPLYRSLLISPSFARGFLQFFGAIRYRSSLPADVMELAMCRVGALNGAAFEWMHHAPLLKQAGVSDEGVETVRTAEPHRVGSAGEGGLSERLWKVMRYADAMTKDVAVSDGVFDAVKDEFRDDRQVVELTLTICGYNAVSRFLRAVDVAEMKDTPVGLAKL